MPIVIKKAKPKEVEPLVTERTPFEALPVAESLDQLWDHPGRYRAPQPSICTVCKHAYAFPCHGKSDKCMNARWARGEAA